MPATGNVRLPQRGHPTVRQWGSGDFADGNRQPNVWKIPSFRSFLVFFQLKKFLCVYFCTLEWLFLLFLIFWSQNATRPVGTLHVPGAVCSTGQSAVDPETLRGNSARSRSHRVFGFKRNHSFCYTVPRHESCSHGRRGATLTGDDVTAASLIDFSTNHDRFFWANSVDKTCCLRIIQKWKANRFWWPVIVKPRKQTFDTRRDEIRKRD